MTHGDFFLCLLTSRPKCIYIHEGVSPIFIRLQSGGIRSYTIQGGFIFGPEKPTTSRMAKSRPKRPPAYDDLNRVTKLLKINAESISSKLRHVLLRPIRIYWWLPESER